MNILDAKIRVEFNSWGGVVFHIPEHQGKPPFMIYNTIGSGWTAQRASDCIQPDGTWGPTDSRFYSDQIIDVYWKAMGWGDTVHSDDTICDKKE